AAKDDLNAYSLATTNAVNTLHTMVVQDPSIPAELKGKLIQEALTYALSTDNLTMYELARNTDVPLPGGRTGKLTELIPLDKQTLLAAAYRESGNRTSTLRNMQLLSQIGE